MVTSDLSAAARRGRASEDAKAGTPWPRKVQCEVRTAAVLTGPGNRSRAGRFERLTGAAARQARTEGKLSLRAQAQDDRWVGKVPADAAGAGAPDLAEAGL